MPSLKPPDPLRMSYPSMEPAAPPQSWGGHVVHPVAPSPIMELGGGRVPNLKPPAPPWGLYPHIGAPSPIIEPWGVTLQSAAPVPTMKLGGVVPPVQSPQPHHRAGRGLVPSLKPPAPLWGP